MRAAQFVVFWFILTLTHHPQPSAAHTARGQLRVLLLATCAEIHPACLSCKESKASAAVVGTQICTKCMADFTLTKGTCDCGLGLMLVLPAKPAGKPRCDQCSQGSYCPGLAGGATGPVQCPAGLTTAARGAKDVSQCVTLPGFGRYKRRVNKKLTYVGQECGIGSWSTGGSRLGCRDCPKGLTTLHTGAATPTACVAPPGYFVTSSGGVECPLGSFQPTHNNQSSCVACPAKGSTTVSTGSTSPTDCNQATKGFFLDPASALPTPCPLNTLTIEDNTASFCDACPNGLQTQQLGTDDLSKCVAPPGWELRPGAATITKCARGSFKGSWDLSPCTLCGAGLDTGEEGAQRQSQCMVIPGWAVVRTINGDGSFTFVTKLCLNNTFSAEARLSLQDPAAVCTACSQGLFTLDALAGIKPPAGGYAGEDSCKTPPGWFIDASTRAPLPCPVASFSPGLNRAEECQGCRAGFITAGLAATKAEDCFVRPGWFLNTSIVPAIAQPCPAGSWGAGGSATANRHGACSPCPTGYSTIGTASTSAAECTVCAPGFGGAPCSPCTHGQFGSGIDDCVACPAGFTSRRGSARASQCLAVWPMEYLANTWNIPLSYEAWTQLRPAEAATKADCAAACEAREDCFLYRFKVNDGSFAAATTEYECQGLIAVAEAARGAGLTQAVVGFKAFGAGQAQDFSYWWIPRTLLVGQLLEDVGVVTSAAACQAACQARDDCMIVRLLRPSGVGSRYNCSLHGLVPDSAWMAAYRVAGPHLAGDGYTLFT